MEITCVIGVKKSHISNVGAWRSLEAYLNGVQRVGGSNPLAPTSKSGKPLV